MVAARDAAFLPSNAPSHHRQFSQIGASWICKEQAPLQLCHYAVTSLEIVCLASPELTDEMRAVAGKQVLCNNGALVDMEIRRKCPTNSERDCLM